MWLLNNCNCVIRDAMKYIILSWQETIIQSRYNMELVSEDNKEKASTQAVADKNKATKEAEVTDAEKKVKF